MFIVDSYFIAVILCVVTMICWGSWGNTQKLAAKTWRYEYFYWDYVIGLLLFSILSAFTLGSVGSEGRSFLPDLAQADWSNIGIALLGGVAILLGRQEIVFFSAALTVFLLGMGMINPLGTAIALQPFGRQAGAASALLGFLQMGCAAVAISAGAALDAPAYTSFGIILTASLTLAFLAFLALR